MATMTQAKRRWLAYLASPQWRASRDRWHRRHPNASCSACGSKRFDLHHLQHDRSFTKDGRFRGAERDSDLIPLCRVHHDMAHRYWASRRFATRRLATLAMVSDVRSGPRSTPRSPAARPRRRLRRVILALVGWG